MKSIALYFILSIAQLASAEAEIDWSHVDRSKLGFAYVNPEANFGLYKKVYIADVAVEFDEQWERKFSGEGYGSYKKRIALSYGEKFKSILSESLVSKGSFILVEKREEDALVVLPKLTHLYIEMPEAKGIRDTVMTIAGRAAVDITVYSPRHKQGWALFVDKRGAGRVPAAEATMPARVVNEKSFTRLFEHWSQIVVDYLVK